MTQEFLYRYDGWASSYNDSIDLSTYRIVKETPCGYWIIYGTGQPTPYDRKKFVLKKGFKRYAWPTPEMALEHFARRKKNQMAICKAKADEAERHYLKAEKMLEEIRNVTKSNDAKLL